MPQTREHLAVLEQLEVPGGRRRAHQGGPRRSGASARSRRSRWRTCWPGARTRGPGCERQRRPRDRPRRAARRARQRCAGPLRSEPRLGGPPRLHVDRSFTLQGIGTVVTGTLWSGTIARGAEVRIEPGGARARVRSVEVHVASRGRGPRRGSESRSTSPGSSAARSSAETWWSAAMRLPPRGICVDAAVRLLAGARPLRRGARVHVHHGTRETAARVSPVEGERLEPGRAGLAQLRLERPSDGRSPATVSSCARLLLRTRSAADASSIRAPRKHGPGEAHAVRLGALALGRPAGGAPAGDRRGPLGPGDRRPRRGAGAPGRVRRGCARRRAPPPLVFARAARRSTREP